MFHAAGFPSGVLEDHPSAEERSGGSLAPEPRRLRGAQRPFELSFRDVEFRLEDEHGASGLDDGMQLAEELRLVLDFVDHVEREDEIDLLLDPDGPRTASMERDVILQPCSRSFDLDSLEHPLLQVGRDHLAGASHHYCHRNGERSGSAADIEDSHPFADMAFEQAVRTVQQQPYPVVKAPSALLGADDMHMPLGIMDHARFPVDTGAHKEKPLYIKLCGFDGMRSRHGAAFRTSTPLVIMLIGLILVLYLLFLTPTEREALLNGGKAPTGGYNPGTGGYGGAPVSGGTMLMDKYIGTLLVHGAGTIDHSLPSTTVFTAVNTEELKFIDSMIVKQGAFSKQEGVIVFRADTSVSRNYGGTTVRAIIF